MTPHWAASCSTQVLAATDFERARTRPDAQPLDVAAVHRIEQPRDRGEPFAPAFLVVIKDLL